MSIHVVIFETEPHVARMIACRLMRADFEVHSVHDVESGWDVICRVQPQLLITDVADPALELISRIRSTPSTRELPILGLTQAGDDPMELELLHRDWHFAAVLQKPFSPRRMVRLAAEIALAPLLASSAV